MKSPHTSPIELRLRDLAQLFNSMDPSPFNDRDLDAVAEAFIVEWARELPAGREFELTIELATMPSPERAEGLEDAVHNYFKNRVNSTRSRLRRLFRMGRWSLLIGVLFLAACLTLGGLVGKAGNSSLLATGKLTLDIIGWVALWRPLEIFLYEWWPLRDDIRLYERLARMRVRLILPAV